MGFKKKKVLLLGGSYGQLPAINEAKKRGLHTILCDYLPDNPGREKADEFYLLSTTDVEKVTELALSKGVDAIVAYASDPAAYTAAYVSEKIGLVGNTPESVKLLSQKGIFRAFQKSNGFNVPAFQILTVSEKTSFYKPDLPFPLVVKPVDGSDTKGVTLVRKPDMLQTAMDFAWKYSRCNRIIIEEVVDAKKGKLHGDGFVKDGELVFCKLGDHIFASVADPLKPSCTSFPSLVEKAQIQRVESTLKEMIKKSGYKDGPVNIEARIDSNNDVYIMEIGPRSGGCLTPQTIDLFCGFNMMKAQLDLLLGEKVNILDSKFVPAILFVIHSNKKGLFRSFKLHEDLKPYLHHIEMYVEPGDEIKSFREPGSSIGIIILNFKTMDAFLSHKAGLYDTVLSGLKIAPLK